MPIDKELADAVRAVAKEKSLPDDAVRVLTAWLVKLADTDQSTEDNLRQLELLLAKIDVR